MSNWAELDENNYVKRVVVCDNNDNNNDEGYRWLVQNLGGVWVKGSYNTRNGIHILGGTPFRKNSPEPGYFYSSELDAFIPPKPFESWILNEETCCWEAPISRPENNNNYYWDEDLTQWVLLENNE